MTFVSSEAVHFGGANCVTRYPVALFICHAQTKQCVSVSSGGRRLKKSDRLLSVLCDAVARHVSKREAHRRFLITPVNGVPKLCYRFQVCHRCGLILWETSGTWPSEAR